MIPRVLLVWLPFSMAVLLLGLYSQGEPFEVQQLFLSLAISTPVALAVARGGLGDASSKQLHYPSATLMIISAWILGVAPSLVVESREARFLYHYSDAALALARVFFFGWCLLFVAAAGKPRLSELKAKPVFTDFVAFTAFALFIAGYLVRTGIFSYYQSSRVRFITEAGSTESVATVLGPPLFTLLPPLLFLMLMRMQGRPSQFLMVFIGFLGSWGLVFLLGSRTSVVMAVASCLLLCRGLDLRLRANVLLGLGVAVPVALVLILVYRNALSTSESGATDFGQYISIASDATSSLNDQQAQTDAFDLVENNVRVRLWYGQQFCVLVDTWLEEGAAMRGSIFAGIISSLPTLFVSQKNALATELTFERILIVSQRFPDIDLAPTPWMQWLFELGVPGLIIGALIYSWLVRLLESRIHKTRSFYEILLWLQIFIGMLAPEHTTDVLVLFARGILVTAIVVSTLSRALTWMSSVGRRVDAM